MLLMLSQCVKAQTCLIVAATQKMVQPELPLPKSRGFDSAASVLDELLVSKSSANRTSRYVISLGHYLRQFLKGREQISVADFTTGIIEGWLAKYPAPNTRRTWLSRLSAFFSFAVRRGYLEKNPCDKIERVTMDRKPPKILTVAESRLILKSCATVCRPYLVLGMFAGIRPEEVMRLNWSQINLETKTVMVDGKTRRRRIVNLEPIAVSLLLEHPMKSGMVAPSLSTVVRWKKWARAVLNLPKFPQDLLRHTAASYLIALHGDAGKVSMILGNSTRILLTHYHEPVSSADCAAFWASPPR